jgi:hypothetical protein
MTALTSPIEAFGKTFQSYEAYALERDLRYIHKFVQSNCRYKTSYYEATKWDAYGAYYRIKGQQGQNLVNLATCLREHGMTFKPGRVATRVLTEAGLL